VPIGAVLPLYETRETINALEELELAVIVPGVDRFTGPCLRHYVVITVEESAA